MSSVDLRDYFAIRFASRLAGGLYSAEYIATKAYDLAEAMIAERARRVLADERQAIEADSDPSSFLEGRRWRAISPLLDELPPPSDLDAYEPEIDPRWMEPEDDPSWDKDPRWSPEHDASARPSTRPGLARTDPEQAIPADKSGTEDR